MDDLSIVVQSLIDSELDDLLLDLVYEMHSSLKGIPDDQLEITKTRKFSTPYPPYPSTAIEKHTCTCPHCGQPNLVAIRFAYHLAKCLGVGRRSSRRAKHRIVDQVLTITASSDDSRSNGDDIHNGDGNPGLPEDAGSCTDSTSSSTNVHRRLNNDNHDDRHDFDYNNNNDEDDEDDWKPKKKRRRSTHPSNQNSTQNKTRRKPTKDQNNLLLSPQTKNSSIDELDFHNCIIPLDKLCSHAKHVVIPLASSSTSSTIDDLFLKTRHVSPSLPTRSSSPTVSSRYYVRSPFHLAEDEQSSTSTIILFPDDTQR